MVTRDRGYWATVGGKASIRRGRPLTEWRGILPPAEVTEIYRRTDLFIFPTQYEAFPLVVIEAVAAGLPVLVSDSLAPGIVIDDRKGAVIAGHDPSKYAEALMRLANPAIRAAMSEAKPRGCPPFQHRADGSKLRCGR